MLLCFNQTQMCLLESHCHGSNGGLISTSTNGQLNDFVDYIEQMTVRDWNSGLRGSNVAILGLK